MTLGAIAYFRKVRTGSDRLIPKEKLGVRNLFELVVEATLSIAEGVMGAKKAEKYLPLIGTLVFFILFNNLDRPGARLPACRPIRSRPTSRSR